MKTTKPKRSISTQVHPDLDGLRSRVERRREYLDLLEIELTNTRKVVREFTQVYNDRIAPLEKERSRLRELLLELTEDQAPPASGWLAGRVRGAAADGSGESSQANGKDKERILPKKKAQAKDPDDERRIRELFRKLAKRYHPDVARDDEEKQHNESLMAEINRAYMEKDLEALEALAKSHSSQLNRGSQSPQAELARLELELRQLEAMIFEVENTIRDLDLSTAMQMYGDSKGERGSKRDQFASMEAELRTSIEDLREQLMGMGAELGGQIE